MLCHLVPTEIFSCEVSGNLDKVEISPPTLGEEMETG